jgi:hypothetical protein
MKSLNILSTNLLSIMHTIMIITRAEKYINYGISLMHLFLVNGSRGGGLMRLRFCLVLGFEMKCLFGFVLTLSLSIKFISF